MTIPGGFVAGDILGAADMNLLPGGIMGYAQVVANQATITTETDITSLTVTWTAVSSRRYRTSFLVHESAQTALAASDYMRIFITNGSNTHIQEVSLLPTEVDVRTTVVGSVVETSLSGSTTRKLRAVRFNNDGYAMSILAAATYPAFILVEDIGPA